MASSLSPSSCNSLYDANFKTNVVINAHIKCVEKPGQDDVEEAKREVEGLPMALGSAISPLIPSFFNSMLLVKVDADGSRRIHTKPQFQVSTKTAAPLSVKPHYPIETGLASYFEAIRGPLTKDQDIAAQ